MELDFVEEYKEFSGLPKHIAVVYKFFSLFSVTRNYLTWSKKAETLLDEEQAVAFKKYLKHSKSILREGEVKAGECSKMMLFLYMKIQEFSLFDLEVRREIMKYMEVCELVIC